MTLGDIWNLTSSKDGDELFLNVVKILNRFGVAVVNDDGTYKDLRVLCFEVAEVMNKEK